MRKIFKAQTNEGYTIKVLSDLLQNNIKTACLIINGQGIKLTMYDSHRRVCFEFILYAENFQIYKFRSETPLYLGINLCHFYKMIKSIKKKDSIILFINEDQQDDLGIRVIPKENNRVTTSFIKMKKGEINKRKRSNQVMSNSIGGYDKSNRFPCRLTNWTRKNLDAYKSVYPLSQKVSELYFSYCPDKWLNQYDKYIKSPPEYTIPDTNFSTLTINCDFRTAAHKDAGDCKDGMTAFTVKDLDNFKGGELVFPTYDLALDIREGDLLIFNPHITHCNNPLTKQGRMSFVFYLREKMDKCNI